MDKDIQRKIKELEKAGFKVKREVRTERKTFEVPTDLVKEFMATVRANDLKVKDAIAEAIETWVKSNKR